MPQQNMVPTANTISPKASASKTNRNQAGSLNSTAYRIFKILDWLKESPLTIDELNTRFLADPQIGKTLSPDSIWLYLNTLRLLGCQISRPSPSNQFKYSLQEHPFGLHLNKAELLLLSQGKTLAEELLDYEGVLALDALYKSLLAQTCSKALLPSFQASGNESNLEPGLSKAEVVALFFEQTRSLDYEAQKPIIENLKHYCQTHELVEVAYRSPVAGRQLLWLLCDQLIYRSGVLYLQGLRSGYEDMSLLRVDRIIELSVLPSQNPLRHQLLQQWQTVPMIDLLILEATSATWEPMGFNEELEDYNPHPETPCLRVRFKSRDFFLIRQKLLALGLHFKVLAPYSLRQSLQQSLEALSSQYEADEATGLQEPQKGGWQ